MYRCKNVQKYALRDVLDTILRCKNDMSRYDCEKWAIKNYYIAREASFERPYRAFTGQVALRRCHFGPFWTHFEHHPESSMSALQATTLAQVASQRGLQEEHLLDPLLKPFLALEAHTSSARWSQNRPKMSHF